MDAIQSSTISMNRAKDDLGVRTNPRRMIMTDNRIALVVGANGGIGGEVARVLVERGWTVRGLSRTPESAKGAPGIVWVKGDAMNKADVVAAAAGASLVVHGANPPGYKNWAGLAMPMLENSIAA